MDNVQYSQEFKLHLAAAVTLLHASRKKNNFAHTFFCWGEDLQYLPGSDVVMQEKD